MFTVALWARIETTTADTGQLFGINQYEARVQVRHRSLAMHLYETTCSTQIHSDSKLRTEGTSGTSAYSSASTKVRDGSWHHVVVSYGLTYTTIYIDGMFH